jgi:ParB-like chromosome segregation protein Spo0J
MKMGKNNDQQREMRIQYIPMGKIDIPSGQQKFGNPTARVASIQRVGLLQPIVVTPRATRYRVLVGLDLWHACALLGWTTISNSRS